MSEYFAMQDTKNNNNFIKDNRLKFSKNAQNYNKYARFQSKVGCELLLKLENYLNIRDLNIKNILDLGSGTGAHANNIIKITKANSLYMLDQSADMLNFSQKNYNKNKSNKSDYFYICADMHNMPFKNNYKIDLVFSNLAMQWCVNWSKLFADINNLLNSKGLFVFSVILDGSLFEIDLAWQKLFTQKQSSVNSFMSKQNILDIAENKGLSKYLFEFKKIVCKFDSLFDLFASVKKIGASNVYKDKNSNFFRGLMTPRKFKYLESIWPKDEFGKFELSYNIGYFIYEKK